MTQFKTNTKTHKEVDHLLGIKMEPGDSLKAYNTKYWETFNEILDCPTNLAITQYKCGLLVGHRLRDSLTMSQLLTMELLMQRINEHIRVEDDATIATTKVNSVAVDKKMTEKVHTIRHEVNRLNKRKREYFCGADYNSRGKGQNNDQANYPRDVIEDTKQKLNARTGITSAFKIPINRILSKICDEAYVRWLAKLGNAQRGFNPRYRCTYHDECDHRIEDCRPLKQHLEELVATDHHDRYINKGVKATPQAQAKPNGLATFDAPPKA
ncbi:uncharacterized protein LOC114261235 [Camellia sinensis]|uniref:uncharacterized protein LOC114261235 n=1 Tax=Camellia sinensis TaxID=4442 RepID=UPI00103576C9|nr:uncharacterized protein LOC114261235 [Camellia sinensis]